MPHAWRATTVRLMQLSTTSSPYTPLTHGLFIAAAGLLALDPILWLARTWMDPSYDSQGALVFLACAALAAWSLSSPRASYRPANKRLAFSLLAATAIIRAVGQILAINTIGAIALVLDVYALALLTGMQYRLRPISPFWLSLCFALSLPVERIVQRTIGYVLQEASAEGACMLLSFVFPETLCEGLNIVLDAKEVLVDLPCSGARAMVLFLLLFTFTSSLVRPTILQAALGLAITFASAFIANAVRISLLAAGMARPQLVLGADVMAQPWHDIVGLVPLALAALPVLIWARRCRQTPLCPRRRGSDAFRWTVPDRVRRDGAWIEAHRGPSLRPLGSAVCFAVLAVAIVSLPHRPLDVVSADLAIELPARIAGNLAIPVSLNPTERAYFTRYGGFAAKASYGANGLLVVRTTSPLRHIHAPEDCLRGLGFEVEYLGIDRDPLPSATYRARTPEGDAYIVRVSFVSDRGHVTGNVAEVVWKWLGAPTVAWSAVQRITPEGTAQPNRRAIDNAVSAALDLPRSSPPSPQLTQLEGALQ